MVRECIVLVNNIILQENTYDSWRWLFDPIHGYTVCGTYLFLTSSGGWGHYSLCVA